MDQLCAGKGGAQNDGTRTYAHPGMKCEGVLSSGFSLFSWRQDAFWHTEGLRPLLIRKSGRMVFILNIIALYFAFTSKHVDGVYSGGRYCLPCTPSLSLPMH